MSNVTADSFIGAPVVFSVRAENDWLEVGHSFDMPAGDDSPKLSGRVLVEFEKDCFALKIKRTGDDDIEMIYSPAGGAYILEEIGLATSIFVEQFGYEIFDSMINAALGAVKKLAREQPTQLTQAQKQLVNCAERYITPNQPSKGL